MVVMPRLQAAVNPAKAIGRHLLGLTCPLLPLGPCIRISLKPRLLKPLWVESTLAHLFPCIHLEASRARPKSRPHMLREVLCVETKAKGYCSLELFETAALMMGCFANRLMRTMANQAPMPATRPRKTIPARIRRPYCCEPRPLWKTRGE